MKDHTHRASLWLDNYEPLYRTSRALARQHMESPEKLALALAEHFPHHLDVKPSRVQWYQLALELIDETVEEAQ